MLNEKKAAKEEEQARMYAFMGDLYERKFQEFDNIRNRRKKRLDSFPNVLRSPYQRSPRSPRSPHHSPFNSPNRLEMSAIRTPPRQPLARSTPVHRRAAPTSTVTSASENVQQTGTPDSASPDRTVPISENVEEQNQASENNAEKQQPKDYVLPLDNNLVPNYSDDDEYP